MSHRSTATEKSIMKHPIDNEATVRRLFAFVEGRGGGASDGRAASFAAYAELYHPAVAIHEAECLPYGGCYRGPEGVARHAQAFRRAWDGLQLAEDEAMDPRFRSGDDEVVGCWTLRGSLLEPSLRCEMPVVSTYRLLNGCIVEARMHHYDPSATAIFLARARREVGWAGAASPPGDA